MAKLYVDDTQVRVELNWWERPFAGRRTRLAIPLAEIRDAERVARPTRYTAAPGGRAGLVVTGVLKLGRWGIGTRTHRFLSVRRWVPAVRLRVSEDFAHELGYAELLISTPEADTVIATIMSAAERR